MSDGGLVWAKREYEAFVELQAKGLPISAIKRMREIWWQAYKAGQENMAAKNLSYLEGKAGAIIEFQILLDRMNRDLADAIKSK